MVEHLGDGAPQRLGAVEHHQDRPGHLQATLPQPQQQVTHHGGVLGGTLGEGERNLGAIRGDAERDHAAVLGHPDAVHQQRHQVQPVRSWASSSARPCSVRPRTDARSPTSTPRSGGRNTGADRFQPGTELADLSVARRTLSGMRQAARRSAIAASSQR